MFFPFLCISNYSEMLFLGEGCVCVDCSLNARRYQCYRHGILCNQPNTCACWGKLSGCCWELSTWESLLCLGCCRESPPCLPPLLWQHPFVCFPKASLLLPRTLLQFSVPSCGWDRVVPLLSPVFPCSCISGVTGTSSKGVSPVPSLPLIYFFVLFCTKWILTPIGAVVIKSELPTTIFWLFS